MIKPLGAKKIVAKTSDNDNESHSSSDSSSSDSSSSDSSSSDSSSSDSSSSDSSSSDSSSSSSSSLSSSSSSGSSSSSSWSSSSSGSGSSSSWFSSSSGFSDSDSDYSSSSSGSSSSWSSSSSGSSSSSAYSSSFRAHASKLSKVDNTVITELNLSFKDIATRLTDFYSNTMENLPESLIILINDRACLLQTQTPLIQSVFRRICSNYVNDWDNLVDKDGNYIGDNYGLRITLASNDGSIIHDIQTYCKDVKNDLNGIGKKNNFCISVLDYSEKYASSTIAIIDNYSNIDATSLTNKSIIYNKTFKLASTILPTTQYQDQDQDQQAPSKLVYDYVNYVDGESQIIPETIITEFSSCKEIQNHGTRIEIQVSRQGGYGMAARNSVTMNKMNWYACMNIDLGNIATNFSLRMSIFEWGPNDDTPEPPAPNPFLISLTPQQKAYLISRFSS